MPANATAGAIARYTFLNLVDAVLPFVWNFSRNDTGVVVKNNPLSVDGEPQFTVTMPPNPSDGDQYTYADQDGSVSVESPVIFAANSEPADTTVGDMSLYPLFAPFSTATFTYSADANDWIVSVGAQSALIAASNLAGTVIGEGNVAPANISSETAVILWAAEVNPKSSGIFRVLMTLNLTLAAADTVTCIMNVATGLTGPVTGGGLVGDDTAPFFRYETGASGGGVVVVPSTASTAQGEAVDQVATGNIAKVTLTYAGMVAVVATGTPPTPCAIVCTIQTTGGEAISAMSLNASVQEAA